MLITLWGKAGSGKSTVAKKLAKKLWYEIISIGNMKRQLATEMWLDIQSFNLLWDKPENAEKFDIKYEEYQKSLPLDGKIILDSRLGFYAQPQAFKVLLDVQDDVAAQRILWDNRSTEVTGELQDIIQDVKERNKADEMRYLKLYNIHVWDHENYSLVIDTSDKTPDEIIKIIEESFKSFLHSQK